MVGGLMQVIAYGSQDMYLSGDPRLTFFKCSYRRESGQCMHVLFNSYSDRKRRYNNFDIVHISWASTVVEYLDDKLYQEQLKKYKNVTEIAFNADSSDIVFYKGDATICDLLREHKKKSDTHKWSQRKENESFHYAKKSFGMTRHNKRFFYGK